MVVKLPFQELRALLPSQDVQSAELSDPAIKYDISLFLAIQKHHSYPKNKECHKKYTWYKFTTIKPNRATVME